jgi:hypothetical protein
VHADVEGVHVAAMRSLAARGAPAEVLQLMADRYRLGLEKYGTVLHAGNGRDHRRDLLEELADAVAYAHCLGIDDVTAECEAMLIDFWEWL